jgi:hypothetical protein
MTKMNERIKELAEQATTLKFDGTGTDTGTPIFDKEKFAELIVMECANIALREDHDPYECIKKHFGVK